MPEVAPAGVAGAFLEPAAAGAAGAGRSSATHPRTRARAARPRDGRRRSRRSAAGTFSKCRLGLGIGLRMHGPGLLPGEVKRRASRSSMPVLACSSRQSGILECDLTEILGRPGAQPVTSDRGPQHDGLSAIWPSSRKAAGRCAGDHASRRCPALKRMTQSRSVWRSIRLARRPHAVERIAKAKSRQATRPSASNRARRRSSSPRCRDRHAAPSAPPFDEGNHVHETQAG